PGFSSGRIHRAERGISLASGKGLNVARVVRALGEDATVIGMVGGDDSGRAIIRGARGQGISLRAVRVQATTRICTLILDPGLAAKPDLIKVNRAELADAVGRPLASVDDVLAAADTLRAQSGGQVIVTMGAEGAVLVTAEGRWHLSPPGVTRVNTIGAGDSLTAGVVVSLQRGHSLLDAVQTGVAAAAADVTTLLPGTVDAMQVDSLRPQVVVQARPR